MAQRLRRSAVLAAQDPTIALLRNPHSSFTNAAILRRSGRHRADPNSSRNSHTHRAGMAGRLKQARSALEDE